MAQLKEFVINGIAVVAFILLLKLLASYLPDMNFFGALKRVIGNI